MKHFFSLLQARKPLKWVTLTAGAALAVFLILTAVLYFQPASRAWSLTVSSPSFRFHIGDSADIACDFSEVSGCAYLLRLQQRRKEELAFTSSDESVATVDHSGRVTAVGEGTAVILVTASDLSEEVRVSSFEAGSSLRFEAEEFCMNCGETLTPEVILSPENAVLFCELSFRSLDESVATIDSGGHISALNPGITSVEVSADGLSGSAAVRILQPMSGIRFRELPEEGTLTVERGDTLSFAIDFFPENTTDDRTVSYTLSDPSQGTVDENGLFTAKGRGPVTLTASCGEYSVSADIFISVTLRGISLSDESLSLVYPGTARLSYTLYPADPTETVSVSWSSENTGVVTVDENGLVSAVRGGTADVILSAGGFEQRCTCTVTVPVTGLSISARSLFLYTGSACSLYASVIPEFTTEEKSIVWSSDNPGIASVSAGGTVTAVSPGITVIRASHGSFSASCTVEVADMPTWEERADAIIAFGKQYLGTPYVYGGESLTGGIDCSSFTQQCFASQHISLYRCSYQQVTQGTEISPDPSAWRKGDLIFYSPEGSVSHVAIYIGDGKILHSSGTRGGVVITDYAYDGRTPSHVRRYF